MIKKWKLRPPAKPIYYSDGTPVPMLRLVRGPYLVPEAQIFLAKHFKKGYTLIVSDKRKTKKDIMLRYRGGWSWWYKGSERIIICTTGLEKIFGVRPPRLYIHAKKGT